MSTRERIRIIRLLEKIGRDPTFAKTLGITITESKQIEKPLCGGAKVVLG